MIFLCETKSKIEYMEKVKSRLNFEECYVVEALDRSGGMALLWHSNIKMLEIYHTTFAIEIHVQDLKTQTD